MDVLVTALGRRKRGGNRSKSCMATVPAWGTGDPGPGTTLGHGPPGDRHPGEAAVNVPPPKGGHGPRWVDQRFGEEFRLGTDRCDAPKMRPFLLLAAGLAAACSSTPSTPTPTDAGGDTTLDTGTAADTSAPDFTFPDTTVRADAPTDSAPQDTVRPWTRVVVGGRIPNRWQRRCADAGSQDRCGANRQRCHLSLSVMDEACDDKSGTGFWLRVGAVDHELSLGPSQLRDRAARRGA
jgi:hypothetical protein